jgi:phosphoenolpyruvate-protein kinase (PTS system EI component)
VLSVLIGLVAGFVFDQGSALCHLAILLREAGVPAVASTSLDEGIDGTEVFISEGTVTLATTKRDDYV